MEASELLEKYQNDRRKLLEFLLSSNLIKQPDSTSNSVNSVDSISVDYVLSCIDSGEMLDFSKASNKYTDEYRYPITIESELGAGYFLCCDPDLSGTPPHRVPPTLIVEPVPNFVSNSSNNIDPLGRDDIANSREDDDCYKYTNEADGPCPFVEDGNLLSFGLPSLSTGISEDDLQETTYELLLSYQPEEDLSFHLGKSAPNMIQFLVNVSVGQAAARIISSNQTGVFLGLCVGLRSSIGEVNTT